MRLARFDKLCAGNGFPRSFLSFFALRHVFFAACAGDRRIAAKKERVGQKASEDTARRSDLPGRRELRHDSCEKKPMCAFEEKTASKCKYCVKKGAPRAVGECRKKARKFVQGAQKKAAAKKEGGEGKKFQMKVNQIYVLKRCKKANAKSDEFLRRFGCKNHFLITRG